MVLFFSLQVKEGLTDNRYSGRSEEDGHSPLSTSRSLKLELRRHHFHGGTVRVSCRATLPAVTGVEIPMITVTASLAASKQRLAQEAPKPGSSTSSSSSSSSSEAPSSTIQPRQSQFFTILAGFGCCCLLMLLQTT